MVAHFDRSTFLYYFWAASELSKTICKAQRNVPRLSWRRSHGPARSKSDEADSYVAMVRRTSWSDIERSNVTVSRQPPYVLKDRLDGTGSLGGNGPGKRMD